METRMWSLGSAAVGADPVSTEQPESLAGEIDVSVVMPCLNEQESVGKCVHEAIQALSQGGLKGEIIVVDNGSTDGSAQEAARAGARVVKERTRGYGRALIRGMREARGNIIIMGDCDGTYDFSDPGLLIKPIENGFDLVIGNRLRGDLAPGAMPWAHRVLGTPMITGLLRLFTGIRVGDSQCGLRAIKREALARLDLRASGMEFASEMLVKAARHRLRIAETPIRYRRRIGESKLNTFKDGWRHLRFLVLSSPSYAFLAPGVFFLALGSISLALTVLFRGGITVGSFNWQPIFASSVFLVIGTNAIMLGLVSKLFAVTHGEREDPFIHFYRRYLGFERLLIIGLLVVAVGVGIVGVTAVNLFSGSRGHLELGAEAQSFIIVGANLILGAIMAGVIETQGPR